MKVPGRVAKLEFIVMCLKSQAGTCWFPILIICYTMGIKIRRTFIVVYCSFQSFFGGHFYLI